jgi:hypothetical protein
MKRYQYAKPVLWVSIILPIFLMVGLLFWSVYRSLIEGPLPLYQFLMLIMPLLIISSVVSLHNPSSVTVTSEYIVFEGFGRKHLFNWEEIEIITVKDYGYVGKSFIRVGRYSPFKGRYWISNKLTGYRELLTFLQTKKAGGNP